MKASKTLLRAQGLTHAAMAVALGVMALAVFVNVVLRYGFGSGIAASEELSRLLFVWMVFLGAAAAYPAGEHMPSPAWPARCKAGRRYFPRSRC